MKSVLKIGHLMLYSLMLDLRLLMGRFPLSFLGRCRFIWEKYQVIAKHNILRVPLNSTSDHVVLGRQKLYYGSVYGMAVFQSMITTLNKDIIPILDNLKNPTIIDVGAHLGFFSIPLAAILVNPTIYACEPVSATHNLLKKNIKDFPTIHAFQIGLFDKPEKKTIFYNNNLLMYSSLFSERFTWDEHPHHETIRLNTLDAFCKENGTTSINLLKIDAEGAEERIIKGGTATLARTEYIFMECSLDQVDYTFSSLISLLKNKNYDFQLVKIVSSIEFKDHLLQVNLLLKNTKFKKLN